MNVFSRSISKIFKGAAKAFQTFPAAIGNALAFAIVTMIRIQLDWPQQEDYNFLFNCLHWAFALGAIFSLAAITAAKSRYNHARAFQIANLLGVIAAVMTFLALYLLGGTNPVGAESRFAVVSGLALTRVAVALLVSFLSFIILAGYPKDQSNFASSFFMTQKAFFIALIYGLVIMGGTSGVAGAIEALLYHDMNEKVYMYLATLSGFLAFTIFVGYFPDFRKGQIDKHREVAQNQPRFVEVLFEYIMIPIVLALTVVLLLWAGKTVIGGMGASFVLLSGIATAYTTYGIWLHVMVSHYETGLAKFYRRVYPIVALVILAFEAWALIIQLQKSGLKMTEYFFIVIWIIALASAVLLLFKKDKAYPVIAALICAMAVFSVLPGVGYHALPVTNQVNRLENLLVSQGMLKDGQLIPAATEPDLAVRESITDAVSYLAHTEDAKLPDWFDKRLSQSATFKAQLGFDQIWPKAEGILGNGSNTMGISVILAPEAIDISDYRWALNMQPYAGKEGASVTLKGDRGSYHIYWTGNNQTGIPNLKIELGNRVILDQNMNAYIDKLSTSFPAGHAEPSVATLEDMSLKLETQELSVLLVFSNVEMYVDPTQDRINYYLNLNALYLNEKP